MPERVRPFGGWVKYCLIGVFAASLVLNVRGNGWGGPHVWDPDELTTLALDMVPTGDWNPHFFAYGVLPYYLVLASATASSEAFRRFEAQPTSTRSRHARLIRGARMPSAFAASLLMLVTYLIGATLFGPPAGFLAAFLLAISTGVVTIAHYATVDSVATLAYWVACLSTLRLAASEDSRWYWRVGLAIGLAIGIKADRLATLAPFVVAHGMRGSRRRNRDLVTALACIPIGFVLANPVILFAPFEFADGFVRELVYNALRDAPGTTSFSASIGFLNASMGSPLALLSLLVCIVGCFRLATTRPAVLLWLTSTVVPYYLLVASKTFLEWYTPVLLPAIFVVTSWVLVSVVEREAKLAAALVVVVTCIAAGSTLIRTVSLLGQYEEETRDLASRWIETHATRGASIALPYYPPNIDSDSYRLLELPQEFAPRREELEARDRLEANLPYRRFREALHQTYERLTGDRRSGPLYEAWFDRLAARVARDRLQPLDAALDSVDYAVIFPEKNPELLAHLRLPDSGFLEAARFEPPRETFFRPRVEFVNPPVLIFARAARGGS